MRAYRSQEHAAHCMKFPSSLLSMNVVKLMINMNLDQFSGRFVTETKCGARARCRKHLAMSHFEPFKHNGLIMKALNRPVIVGVSYMSATQPCSPL